MRVIKTEKLKFVYSEKDLDKQNSGTKLVLNGINLNIKRGEFVAILGHNGSGKSTLAKHFNAILTPTAGDVYVLNFNTKDEENVLKIRQNVCMIFQNPDNQLVATIVEEDVAFALENLGVASREIKERVKDALIKVGMYKYKDHPPEKLSGGQKQKVAIAGAIATRPNCIVLDEPTSMLDPKGREDVLNIISMLNEKYGISIILITHFMEEATLAKRIIIMTNGSIVLDDTPKNIFSQVDFLENMGLTVPQVTKLCYELKKSGFKLKEGIIDYKECANELAKYLDLRK